LTFLKKQGLSDLKAHVGAVIETVGIVHQSFGSGTGIDAKGIVLDEIV
jgi:hypothetical protein